MEYSKYFKTIKLASGKTRVILTEDAPETLGKLIQDIHINFFNDCWPNDWVYEIIREAFIDIEAFGNDYITEPDVYNDQLLSWLAENGNAYAISLCNQAIDQREDLGTCIISMISAGQSIAKDFIYNSVEHFIKQGAENE